MQVCNLFHTFERNKLESENPSLGCYYTNCNFLLFIYWHAQQTEKAEVTLLFDTLITHFTDTFI